MPLRIPHLSRAMKKQLFPKIHEYDPLKVKLAQEHLSKFNLLGKEEECANVEFRLPQINGKTFDFEMLGYEQLFNRFGSNLYPNIKEFEHISEFPTKFSTRTGWTVYEGDRNEAIDFPPDKIVILDVEVMYKISPYPVIAVCLSADKWYSWASPSLINATIPKDLITMGNPKNHKLIVGHNVSYDRARIKEEYHFEKANFDFLDTLSLHMSAAGFCNAQRSLYLQKQRNLKAIELYEEPDNLDDELEVDDGDGTNHGAMNSLKDLAKFYLSENLSKSDRDYFKETDISILQNEVTFQKLMKYCATDVLITAKLYQALLPRFLQKCPHPASFVGMLHLAKSYLPTDLKWKEFVDTSESAYNSNQKQIESDLLALAKKTLQTPKEVIENDPWLKLLDWEVRPTKMTKPKISSKGVVLSEARPYASTNTQLIGTPNWYRKLWDPKLKKIRLTLSMNVVPYLLKLEWKSRPIFHDQKFGWLYRTDIISGPEVASQGAPDLDLEGLPACRIPHPGGRDKNCGNPLSKTFLGFFESGVLTSPIPALKRLIGLYTVGTYWSSARDRIRNQMVVWKGDIGAIVPNLIPIGTITRRAVEATWLTAPNARKDSIGSEVKSKLVAPKGYKIVGADVDSQELWIASLYGDSYFGIHGATAIGYMTLQGSKSKGTDLHSTTGAIVGLSRDVAKIFNYSRIYGAGEKYASELIQKYIPTATKESAQIAARNLFSKTKGKKDKLNGTMVWTGGSESFMFNRLESIATMNECRTPALDCQIPDTLLPTNHLGRNFLTSRINWVVQSSGVDYLHLLLISMDYLIRRMNIKARFMISIHDEIRYLVKEEDVDKACLALQISNLWIRCYFSSRCGINDLPMVTSF